MLDLDKDQQNKNNLELTINDDRALIKAAINLYNELQKMTKLELVELKSLEKQKRRNRLEDKL